MIKELTKDEQEYRRITSIRINPTEIRISDIDENTKTTLSKGFKVKEQKGIQLVLVIDEVLEAIEHLDVKIENKEITDGLDLIIKGMKKIRKERKNKNFDPKCDKTVAKDMASCVKELVDVNIRVESFVGANEYGKYFVQAKVSKMEENKTRETLHGKKF